MMPHAQIIDEDQFLVDVRNHTSTELAPKYGVNCGTIARWAKQRGVSCLIHTQIVHAMPEDFEGLAKTKTAREIASMVGCTATVVRKRASRLGFKLAADLNTLRPQTLRPTREEFIELTQTMTRVEIATLKGCTREVVSTWSRHFGHYPLKYCTVCEESLSPDEFINKDTKKCWRHRDGAEEMVAPFALAKRHWGTPSMLPVRSGWPTQNSGLSV